MLKKISIIAFALTFFAVQPIKAEVQFLPNADENKYSKTDTATAAQKCQNAGYTYTNSTCNSQTHGQADRCPYSNSYFKICCPEGYVHKLSECVSDISTDSCHGYYKCDEPTPEARCIAEGYEQSPKIVNGYTIEWNCSYPDPMIRCPYDNSYAKCDTTCKDQGYFAVTTSNPCPPEITNTQTAQTTQYFDIEHCSSNNAYIKCVPGAISVTLFTSNDCKAEGFTTPLAQPYCNEYGCSMPAVPGCPFGKTLKTCADITGSYWKCS